MYNQTAGGMGLRWGETIFDTTMVLSTNMTNAPLRFTAPAHASFVQWYGTVGEDQGEFEMSLLPHDGTGQGINVTHAELEGMHSLTRRSTAQRPINAINELRMIALLNPKIRYDIELLLLEEGKRAYVHGIAFASFVTNATEIEDDWVRAYNSQLDQDANGGLSEGQIAGIVVSVAYHGVLSCSACCECSCVKNSGRFRCGCRPYRCRDLPSLSSKQAKADPSKRLEGCCTNEGAGRLTASARCALWKTRPGYQAMTIDSHVQQLLYEYCKCRSNVHLCYAVQYTETRWERESLFRLDPRCTTANVSTCTSVAQQTQCRSPSS